MEEKLFSILKIYRIDFYEPGLKEGRVVFDYSLLAQKSIRRTFTNYLILVYVDFDGKIMEITSES